jgi:hypothetical protein
MRVLPRAELRLAEHQEKHLLIPQQTNGSPYTPFLFFDKAGFEEYERILHLIWGGFIGLVLLMSTYNLVLFTGVRDTTYFYYIGYIFSFLVLLGIVHGFGYYLFPIKVQQILSTGVIVINASATFFALKFATNFLRFTKKDGWRYSTANNLSYLACLFGVIAVVFSDPDATLLGQLGGALTIFVWVFGASLIVWGILKAVMGIRVSEEEEYEGVDLAECGMEAYPEFNKS